MIIECPQCRAAHSKSDQELASAAAIVCRRCGTSFDARGEKVGAAKASAVVTEATPGADPLAPRPARPAPPAPSGAFPELTLDPGPGAKSMPATATASRGDPLGIDGLDLGLERGPRTAAVAPAPRTAAPTPAAPAAVDEIELDLGVPSKGPAPGIGELALDFGPAENAPLEAPRAGMPPLAPAAASVPPPERAKAASSAGGTELRTQSSSPEIGRSDAALDAVRGNALQQRLEQLRAGDEDAPRARTQAVSGARGNVFPREAWSRFATELARYLRAAPLVVKLGFGAVALLPVLLLVVLVGALAGSDRDVAFVAEKQPLLAGPLAGEAYEQLAPVERAGRVEVFERDGELALVRDSLGRVGYVRAQSLREEPPPAIPSQPFADCARAPFEASLERCQARAQAQFDSCRELCASSSEEPRCLEQCQRRFADCSSVCEQLEPPPATSREEPAPRVTPEEPAAVPAAPVETPRKKLRAKGKKRKAH